jgi:hypothetical protein
MEANCVGPAGDVLLRPNLNNMATIGIHVIDKLFFVRFELPLTM